MTFAAVYADNPCKITRKMICGMNTATAPAQGIATIRSVDLIGPEGRLEAVLNDGIPGAPFTALVCHPHPKGGGNLHKKVVFHAMKVFNDPRWGFGFPVLRFNFRGVGRSQGVHSGIAETGDVLAALAWLENEYQRPIIAAGFSFGAAMALAACCSGSAPAPSGVRMFAALGLPLRHGTQLYRYPCLDACVLPKLFLSGSRDQFAPAQELEQLAASSPNPKQMAFIAGADHFFTGHLPAMQSSLAGWMKEQLQ